MKKLFSIVAMILAVAMTTLTATPALAAAKETLYVSDAVIVAADSYDAAQAKLEKNGYQILDGELNPDLDEQIYIGYKTTTDPDEAITDMAVMNMNGPFSYSSYKQILESQRSVVDTHMKRLIPSIVRYQENYDAGKQSAQLLREALNCFKEDLYNKTPVLMGDYLYSYDGSENARKELTDVFMRGGSEAMLSIEALLAMASESTDDTLAERIAAITYDDVEAHYLEEYDTASAAHKGMKNELADSANLIYNSFLYIQEYLKGVEEEALVENNGEIDFNEKALDEYEYKSAYFKDMPENLNDYINASGEIMANLTRQFVISDVMIYTTFKLIPYDEGTLYDFFMQDAEDIDLNDIYPIVFCMNDAQRALLGNIGFNQLLEYTFADIDEADSETVAAIRDYVGMFGEAPVSVYDGVDLSIFDDGVAFTSATVEHDKLTNDCWLADVLGGDTEIETMMCSTFIATGLAAGFAITALSANDYLARVAAKLAKFDAEVEILAQPRDELYLALQECQRAIEKNLRKLLSSTTKEDAADLLEIHYVLKDNEFALMNEYEKAKKYFSDKTVERDTFKLVESPTPTKVATIIRNVSLILMIITIAYDVYSIVHLICASLPKEEPIPHHLVTTVPTKYGDSYVYYAAAKNIDGGYADINNHDDAEIGWLTLYTTKDAFTSPILADDLSVSTGSSFIAPGMSSLHMFNEEAACNLNDKTYSGSDENAVYVTFKREDSNYNASVFSRNAVVAVGAGGLLLGAALGVLTTSLVKRKKREDADIAGEVVAEDE